MHPMTFFLSRNPLKSSALWAAGEKKCPATLSARVLQFWVETAMSIPMVSVFGVDYLAKDLYIFRQPAFEFVLPQEV